MQTTHKLLHTLVKWFAEVDHVMFDKVLVLDRIVRLHGRTGFLSLAGTSKDSTEA